MRWSHLSLSVIVWCQNPCVEEMVSSTSPRRVREKGESLNEENIHHVFVFFFFRVDACWPGNSLTSDPISVLSLKSIG